MLKNKYLFVLSHMRSRSSVLSHILGSNDQICGYSELKINYQNEQALDEMISKINKDYPCDKNTTYYLDKLLGNQLSICDEVLLHPEANFIIILRDPVETIRSIYNMGAMTNIDWYTDPKMALNYYCSRLLELESLSKRLSGSYLFIESNDLINKPDDMLEEITTWLSLEQPLTKHYKLFPNTGKPGFGDPSENIKRGTLINTEPNNTIDIHASIVEKGKYAYDKCKTVLTSNAIIHELGKENLDLQKNNQSLENKIIELEEKYTLNNDLIKHKKNFKYLLKEPRELSCSQLAGVLFFGTTFRIFYTKKQYLKLKENPRKFFTDSNSSFTQIAGNLMNLR